MKKFNFIVNDKKFMVGLFENRFDAYDFILGLLPSRCKLSIKEAT